MAHLLESMTNIGKALKHNLRNWSAAPPEALECTGRYDAFLPKELDNKIVCVEVPQEKPCTSW